jgi:serine/threonine-protein kinase
MGVSANTEIAGKLRLVKPLGQGSAGQVWLAKHLHLGSKVAVKFLNRDVSLSKTAKERFVREARAIARIRSPHVVQVHDFGFHEEHAYLVMEHLVGETLEDRLDKVGKLTPDQTLRVVTHIAKALQKAHDAGIVHRDIKPANVFLVDYGDEEVAKVVDFGIVKANVDVVTTTGGVSTLTQTGSLLGTPYYMSPEQIQDSGSVGAQSDLWALGVIAYECMVGQLPFDGPNFPTLVMAICRDPVVPPSTLADVPKQFDAWVERALQRDPTARFGSARELARELCQAVLFPDAGECLSIPDTLLPPDLLWSGAFPTARSSITAWGSDPPPCKLTDSSQGLDDPVVSTGPTGETILDVPEDATITLAVAPAGHPPAAVAPEGQPPVAATPDDRQDGSLTSHVSAPSPERKPSWRVFRIPLYALGAIALLAAGWFAARQTSQPSVTSAPPAESATGSGTAQTPSGTAQAPATPATPAVSVSSAPPFVAAPPHTTAGGTVATAASGLPESRPAGTVAPAKATPTRVPVGPPFSTATEAGPTFPKRDPLSERQ